MSWIKKKWRSLLALMLRDRASPEFIARGWAIGMFYGCSIPFGFQLILSVPTALALKGSKVGATVGTFVTNHFTIFAIYPFQCWLGNRLLGGEMTQAQVGAALKGVLAEQSWDSLLALGGQLTASFFLGGAVLAAVFTPLTYFLVLRFVRRHRRVRVQKRKGAGDGAV